MKKIATLAATLVLFASTIFALDVRSYPVFTGDLNKVDYKEVGNDNTGTYIEIGGVIYIVPKN